MKGVIFNALFEMIEQQMDDALLERVIEGAKLPHLGSYTAAGNYPDTEMLALLQQLHQHTGIATEQLLENFGFFLFGFLKQGYAHFFNDVTNAFTLLSLVHHYIHVEVKKLYPDAVLPEFTVEEHTDQKLILLYKSPRAMGDVARGLIKASLHYYQEKYLLEEMYPTGEKSVVRFIITRLL